MKIKNLKITKNVAIFISGLTLLNFGVYEFYTTKTGLKPFKENKYKMTKIYEQELTQNGLIERECYSGIDILDEEKEAIIFKAPYETNKNEIERKNYLIPLDYFSNVEAEAIKKNIQNQEYVLNQDFIIDIIEEINTTPNLNIFKIEQSDNIPELNDYEISYLTREQSNDEYIYVNSKDKDIINSVTYSLIALSLSSCYYGLYTTINNKIKKKEKNK